MTVFSTTLFLLLLILKFAGVAADGLIPGSNASVSCDGSSATEVISDIELNNINVTVLVATCRRVCYVVLGSGNPVRIFVLQMALQVFCIHVSSPAKLSTGYGWTRDDDILFHPSYAGITIRTATTADNWNCQRAIVPAYLAEDIIAGKIIRVGLSDQHILLFVSFYGSIGSLPAKTFHLRDNYSRPVTILTDVDFRRSDAQLFQALTTLIITFTSSYAPKIDLPLYYALSEACDLQNRVVGETGGADQSQVSSATEYFTSIAVKDRSPLIRLALVLQSLVYLLWIGGEAFGYLMQKRQFNEAFERLLEKLLPHEEALIRLIWKRRRNERLRRQIRKQTPKNPKSIQSKNLVKRLSHLILGFFGHGTFLMVNILPIINGVILLDEARWKALHLSVEGIHDNTWGYGQTTAVLIWAPFLLEAIKEIIKHEKKLLADVATTSAIDLEERPAEGPVISGALSTDVPTGRRGLTVSGDRSIQQDRDIEDELEPAVSGVARRDTEARIEGRSGVGQQNTDRAVTWQHEITRDMPAARDLRRRFT
ncbi:hypothetical protein VTL71DRAFT_16462 [Oculimacula yallundae]|uniref:Uncharacterized protein n=1 Tax=Oculimacula yallundae TaxID=86028 RepID=A0ABR4CEI5_9HELO